MVTTTYPSTSHLIRPVHWSLGRSGHSPTRHIRRERGRFTDTRAQNTRRSKRTAPAEATYPHACRETTLEPSDPAAQRSRRRQRAERNLGRRVRPSSTSSALSSRAGQLRANKMAVGAGRPVAGEEKAPFEARNALRAILGRTVQPGVLGPLRVAGSFFFSLFPLFALVAASSRPVSSLFNNRQVGFQ